MAARVAKTKDFGLPEPSEPPAPEIKHCWVTDHRGRDAGLLLAWRQLDVGGWEGRVAHQVLTDAGWMLMEEWLPAGLLDPA